MLDISNDITRDELLNRFELIEERLNEIFMDDSFGAMKSTDYHYKDFFDRETKYILAMIGIYKSLMVNSDTKVERKYIYTEKINNVLYSNVKPQNYGESYCNPDYAEEQLGAFGPYLSYLAAEIQGLPGYIFDDKLAQVVYLLELFLQVYCLFNSEDVVTVANVENAICSYASDYIDYFVLDSMYDRFVPQDPSAEGCSVAYDIVMNEDLSDLSYLYKYGEYISDSEVKLAQYLNSLDEKEIISMAETYVQGFRRGFKTMGIPFEGKNSVWIRYHIGQERMVREAAKQFGEMGLKAIFSRCSINRTVRRGVVKQGYESTSVNKQFEFDHMNDLGIFLKSQFKDLRVQATEKAYKQLEGYLKEFAGPAVIETFGEELFSPISKESATSLSEQQQSESVEMYGTMGQIGNKYLPGDSYSFTIIAYPMPDIGEDFEAIFDETVKINTLDNDKYIKIQQSIIDTLDVADIVRVEGMNGNRTNMTVQLRHLEAPVKQTQFENCTADVNIPLGEVFTSPVLKGTNGVLNVSGAYLNGYHFKDIEITFADGVVKEYNCANFLDEEDGVQKGKDYIKENILFYHDFLPLGEFAIGTNTFAYTMAQKYNILEKLPILIVEKTGPHFAVGDTCYSHMEDHAVFNPDGKEIVSRENDFSLLRDSEPDKAYFNCHTDITIPYNELGRLYTVDSEGNETDIIVNGRFVLPGTEELNKALD